MENCSIVQVDDVIEIPMGPLMSFFVHVNDTVIDYIIQSGQENGEIIKGNGNCTFFYSCKI